MPIYQRLLLHGFKHLPPPFKHPVTASAMQMIVLWILVAAVCGVQRIRQSSSDKNNNNNNNNNDLTKRGVSCSIQRILSPRVRLTTFILNLLLPSLSLAGVIALSNIGISGVSINIHVILKSSEVTKRPTLLHPKFASKKKKPKQISLARTLVASNSSVGSIDRTRNTDVVRNGGVHSRNGRRDRRVVRGAVDQFADASVDAGARWIGGVRRAASGVDARRVASSIARLRRRTASRVASRPALAQCRRRPRRAPLLSVCMPHIFVFFSIVRVFFVLLVFVHLLLFFRCFFRHFTFISRLNSNDVPEPLVDDKQDKVAIGYARIGAPLMVPLFVSLTLIHHCDNFFFLHA
jgi:hypothetical protein